MALILAILKITGIILLLLLLLLISVLLLVLFVPVRYHLLAGKYEELHVKVSITWLLRIIQVIYNKEGKISKTDIKILGITLGREDIENAGEKKEEKEEFMPQDKDTPLTEPPDKPPDINVNEPEGEPDNYRTHKKSGKFKLRKKDKVKEESSFRETLKKINDYPYKKEALAQTGKLINRLLRGLLDFKVIKSELRLGAGPPHITAYIIGFIRAAIPGFNVTGEFEHTVFEGHIAVKGKLYLYKFVFAAALFIFNRSIWPLVKKYYKDSKAN